MFENIGKKLKSFAKITCWIEIILFIIVGLSIYSEGEEMGIFIAILGAILSWIGAWMTYGFGEIIDCVQQLTLQNLEKTSLTTTASTLSDNKHSEYGNSANQQVVGKINHLNKLRKDGLISEEEYIQHLERIRNEIN